MQATLVFGINLEDMKAELVIVEPFRKAGRV